MTHISNRKVGVDVLYLTGVLPGPKFDPRRFDGEDEECVDAMREAAYEESENYGHYIDDLQSSWSGNEDHIVDALARATTDRDKAARTMRLLIAYAREVIVGNRPTLESLAVATGLTVSGVRGTYHKTDVEEVRKLLGGIDSRRHVELIGLHERVTNIVEYLDTLFSLHDEILNEASSEVLYAAVMLAMSPVEIAWLAKDVELQDETWPLLEATRILEATELGLSLNGWDGDVRFRLSVLPGEWVKASGNCVEYSWSTLSPYFDGGLLSEKRDDAFAPALARLNAVLKSPQAKKILAHVRELSLEEVPSEGEAV